MFPDSRYLTMGCSCRTVIAGFLTGISSLVRYSRQVKKCSEYYIHGFDRMTPEVVAVAMLAAVSSSPCEALNLKLLEDDRVMLQLDLLWKTVEA